MGRSERTAKVAPKGRLVVELSAGPNLDYESPDEPKRTMRVPSTFMAVDTLAEAADVCRRFQKSRGLGYGNWTGGMVYDDAGLAVAKVEYGGSVWDPVTWRREIDVKRFDMARRVAGEIMKVARELEAAPQKHGFTELKPIRFKPFYSTSYCLYNARMIKAAGYELVDGYFTYDTNKGDYRTTAHFGRGEENQTADFFGFSIGYGGEGPHGMKEFGQIFGWNFNDDNVFGRNLLEQADPGSISLQDL